MSKKGIISWVVSIFELTSLIFSRPENKGLFFQNGLLSSIDNLFKGSVGVVDGRWGGEDKTDLFPLCFNIGRSFGRGWGGPGLVVCSCLAKCYSLSGRRTNRVWGRTICWVVCISSRLREGAKCSDASGQNNFIRKKAILEFPVATWKKWVGNTYHWKYQMSNSTSI